MRIKATHPCNCGHKASDHTVGVFFQTQSATPNIASVEKVLKNSINCGWCSCKKFRLPNLDLIEYLAKKRNLI